MTKPASQHVTEITPQPTGKRPQISRKVRDAVRLMVWDGLTRKAAAERAGITDQSLYRAFTLAKVKNLYAQELADLRSNGPARAYINMINLAEQAKSEDVRFRANSWIAGVDGLAPVSKVQGQVQVNHTFGGYSYGKPGKTIDGEVTDN